jgi:hypothetical protein
LNETLERGIKMKKTWTEQEALELIEKVEAEFVAHLAEMKPLAKSEDESKDEDKKEDKKDESKAEEMDKCGDMAMKKAEEQPAAEPESKEETVEDLYKSMSEDEKKAHYDALKKAMAGEEMQKSEAQEAAPKEEPKKDDAAALMKAEMEAVKASNEELKKQNEELKKNLDGVVAALAKRFAKPAPVPKQKAITELGALNKSETKPEVTELSDKEIRKVLAKKAMEPTLTKSDRDLINAYCYNKVDVSAVKHLIG